MGALAMQQPPPWSPGPFRRSWGLCELVSAFLLVTTDFHMSSTTHQDALGAVVV